MLIDRWFIKRLFSTKNQYKSLRTSSYHHWILRISSQNQSYFHYHCYTIDKAVIPPVLDVIKAIIPPSIKQVMARPLVFPEGHRLTWAKSEVCRPCKCVVAAGTVPCSNTLRSQAGTCWATPFGWVDSRPLRCVLLMISTWDVSSGIELWKPAS